MKGVVFVTGGAGYIGSHTCKALALAGYQPVVYDNLSTGHQHNVKWGPLVVGDVGDAGQLVSAFRRYKPDAVLHFAGSAYVGESMLHPDRYFRNNAMNSLVLLECMRTVGIERLIFSSSCTTYGIPQVIPVPLTHPQNPINPYGHSKLMAERMIIEFGDAYGLRYSILRYFNAAGADPEGELKEEHTPEFHLIPQVIDATFCRRGPVTVYGTDYPTPDGTCIRDYVHVSDLAEAHLQALEGLRSGACKEIRNLGTGEGTSVMEIIRSVEKLTGRSVPVIYGQRRHGDPPALVAQADSRELRFRSVESILEALLRNDTGS